MEAPDNTPIPGAIITLAAAAGQEKGWQAELSSGQDGSFNLELPEAGGLYVAHVVADGFLPETRDIIADPDATDVHFVLDPQSSVSGQLVDSDHRPVPGVVLRAQRIKSTADAVEDQATRTSEATGPDGTFLVTGLLPGVYRITTGTPVSGIGAARDFRVLGASETEPLAELHFDRGEQKAGIVLRLSGSETGLAIEGHVRTPDGAPVSEASVWASFGTMSNSALAAALSPTGDDGAFRIDGVNDSVKGRDGRFLKASVVVQCKAEGYEPAYVPNVPWGTRDLTITLVPLQRGALAGIVVDSVTSEPIEGAVVACWQVYTEWGDRWRQDFSEIHDHAPLGVKTGEDGRFILEDVRVGEATLQVWHPDYGLSLHRALFGVAQGQTTQVTIRLEPRGTLQVEVTCLGDFESLESFGCYLEILPADTLTIADEQPWEFTYGSLSACTPVDVGAAMRFGAVATHQQGKQSLARTAQDRWEAHLALGPGNYGVKVRGQQQMQVGGRTSPISSIVQQAIVLPGQTTLLSFELGGDCSVEGTILGQSEDLAGLLLVLSEESAAEWLDPSLGGDRMLASFLSHQLLADGFAAYIKTSGPGPYRFSPVSSGSYCLSAYFYDPYSHETKLQGKQDFTLQAGTTHLVDF